MKITKEKFKTDVRNKLYWGRVYFKSDNLEYKTKVMWVMSYEWVRRELLMETWGDENVEKLVNKMVNKYKTLKNSIFREKVRLGVYGINDQEMAELMKYIQERERMDRHG